LGIFYGYFVYFSRFGMLQQEKSGNPGSVSQFVSFASGYAISDPARKIQTNLYPGVLRRRQQTSELK
jgi:hypothetical protein